MSDDIYYCGLGPVPKGKKRAPPEYCLQKRQVRYWGVEAIDPELLAQYQKKETSLLKEQMKLKKIEDQAKKLDAQQQQIDMLLKEMQLIKERLK